MCFTNPYMHTPAPQDLPTIDICEKNVPCINAFSCYVLFGCPCFGFQRLGDLGFCHYYSCLVRIILFSGFP